MKFPDDVKKIIMRKFTKYHKEWLKSDNLFPIEINLDIPTEQEALRQTKNVKNWVSAWEKWQNNTKQDAIVSELIWTKRCFRILGTQLVPEKLVINNELEAVSLIDKIDEWICVVTRYNTMIEIWPELKDTLTKYYSFLAASDEENYSRLIEMLKWITNNQDSNIYPRQIPVAGIDSKWLESHKKIVSELVAIIKNVDNTDFYEVCGLKSPPQLIRIRVLDPTLRSLIGGLCDISVSLEEAVNLAIKPKTVFIVENLQTGLAFQDLPGSVVIMGLGYGVDVLEKLPWLCNARCIYWGDIDTHGFAILDRARKYLPSIKSILMDEATLLAHRRLCVEEKKQHSIKELPRLTEEEQHVYRSLKRNVWGQNIRLEQERVCWEAVCNIIKKVTG